MIGYLKPRKVELVIKDYQYYKLYYCSICRHLARYHSSLHSFLTGYEGALLAMLYNEMVTRRCDPVKDRCTGVPIAKVPVLPAGHEAVELGAFLCLLAFKIKFQDDLQDEKGFWITRYNRFFKTRIDRAFALKTGAAGKFNIDLRWLASRQEELRRLEESAADIEVLLDAWGGIFSYIMTQPFAEKITAQRFAALRGFFHRMGRVINLLDAMQDLHADHAARRFNPILRVERDVRLSDAAWREEMYKKYAAVARMEQNGLLRLLPELELWESLPILQNILTHCLDNELKKVFDFMIRGERREERLLFNCKDF